MNALADNRDAPPPFEAVVRLPTERGVQEYTIPDALRPLGWRILIRPKPIKDMSDGGIALPGQAVDAKRHLNPVGQVIAMGPLCYRGERFQEEPWCKVGDWVVFGQYQGLRIDVAVPGGDPDNPRQLKAESWRLVNDDQITMVVSHPDLIRVYEVVS